MGSSLCHSLQRHTFIHLYFFGMINYTTATTDNDLLQILDLQQSNLPVNLTSEQISSQGFVTVQHSFADLKKMNDIEQHIIAKDGSKVVAYLLAMTPAARNDIEVLVPMFQVFDGTDFRGKKISACRYIVVGQVCIADGYRGQGVLDHCYARYKSQFSGKYDFAITEIDVKNGRSLNAHKRIGFQQVRQYKAADGKEWDVVLWDWKA